MSLNHFDAQPVIESDLITLRPLKESDFDALFNIASDPLIWEQHPAKERSQKDGFTEFFKEAIAFKTSFAIIDSKTNEIIGSSRYRLIEGLANAIEIGWTFLARRYWGGIYNKVLKKMMIDHAFNFVDNVFFYIHEANFQSQKAVEKLGGQKVTTFEGEILKTKSADAVVYIIAKANWHE